MLIAKQIFLNLTLLLSNMYEYALKNMIFVFLFHTFTFKKLIRFMISSRLFNLAWRG